MEWLDRLQDLLLNHWDKILLYFTTIPVSVIVWKVGNIFVSLIKNRTAKKYLKKIQEERAKLSAEIQEVKECVKNNIKEEVRLYVDAVRDTFNNLQEKTQEQKQKIYEETFGDKMEVTEIKEEIKTEQEAEISVVEEEKPQEEEIIEVQEEVVVEPKKKVDLL